MVYCGYLNKKRRYITAKCVFVKYTPSPGWCRMRGLYLPLSSRVAKLQTIFDSCKYFGYFFALTWFIVTNSPCLMTHFLFSYGPLESFTQFVRVR